MFLLNLIFPPKCILCHKILDDNETDLCHKCREDMPVVKHEKRTFEFIAHWCAIWYYKDSVRESICRYKFNNRSFYAEPYARLLAMKLLDTSFLKSIDVITWAPVSFIRRFNRGYDQAELIAVALGKELELPVMRLLKKHRHNGAQSRLKDAAARKANIQGVYMAVNEADITDKNILLVDDVLTTGATSNECARILITAGAKSVSLAAIAVTPHSNQKKENERR